MTEEITLTLTRSILFNFIMVTTDEDYIDAICVDNQRSSLEELSDQELISEFTTLIIDYNESNR